MGGASFCEGVAPIFDGISLSWSKLHHYTQIGGDLSTFLKIYYTKSVKI